eukprot:13683453-Heterocapsa_arctica.AAC.1
MSRPVGDARCCAPVDVVGARSDAPVDGVVARSDAPVDGVVALSDAVRVSLLNPSRTLGRSAFSLSTLSCRPPLAAAADSTMVTGRQIVCLIYRYYMTNPNMDFTYSIDDLGSLKWHFDHSIHTF